MTYASKSIYQLHTQNQSGVTNAIAKASAKTGVDFSYLMDKAKVESSLNPNAASKTSSATGLYQFVEKTWLQMVRDVGSKYGLSSYAKCIDDNCDVKNPAVRKAILDLRKDPETSAYMAAEYAAKNASILEQRVGDITSIGKTELYMAHFLGASGAAKFIEAMDKNPNARAASVFPAEARSNHNVFYDKAGRARSLSDIYAMFDKKFQNAGDTAPETATSTDTAAMLAPDGFTYEYTAETPVTLDPGFVNTLIEAPAAASPSATLALAALDRSAAQMRHAQLMILAQGYAHDARGRYNA